MIDKRSGRDAQDLGRLELSARRLAVASAIVCVALVAGSSVDAAPNAGAQAQTGARFELADSDVSPGRAFFDGLERIRVVYSFEAERPVDVVIRVIRLDGGEPVRRWIEHDLAPARIHRQRWDARRADGGVPADGVYEFRIGPLGHRGERAGRLELHDHVFPVAGPHTYGDRFGEPRSGGRVHEGQDLPAGCGTPLVAARGGRVQARGYSDALYGYWVLIDGLATKRDYFYAHLEAPAGVADGERVQTGERIGGVGKTGNARGEFCQLHFELWPRGYQNGSPGDPLPSLTEWDSFS